MSSTPRRWFALLAVLLAVPALAAVTLDSPREVSWGTFTAESFRDAWRMPIDRASSPDEPDLRRDVLALAAQEFGGAETPAWTRTLGDVVARFRGLRDDDAGTRRRLDELRRANPAAARALAPLLEQLVREDLVSTDDWDPEEDSPRDGLHVDRPFDLDRLGGAWTRLAGTDDVHQAACLIWADLEALKAAENDYAAYPDNVAADYEAIHAVDGSYVESRRPGGTAHRAVRMYFRQDLPFPYSNYECDLHVDAYLDRAGRLVTDIYADHEDFHWLAGQDVAVPLTTSDGAFVALVLVRVYGFDIDDVPDGTGNRLEALRGSLGNLKRNAEARFRAYGGEPRTTQGSLPTWSVTGAK